MSVKAIPSNQCWAHVGRLSATLTQHKPSIGFARCLLMPYFHTAHSLENTLLTEAHRSAVAHCKCLYNTTATAKMENSSESKVSQSLFS